MMAIPSTPYSHVSIGILSMANFDALDNVDLSGAIADTAGAQITIGGNQYAVMDLSLIHI